MRVMSMLVGLMALALIAGCGGGDDDESSDGDSTATAAATTSSGGSGSGGGDTVDVAAFSMPLPAGAVHENIRTDIGIQLFYPMDDYDEIVAFFEDWTDSEPETYERFDRTNPIGVGWVWLDDSTPQQRTIDVQQSLDAGSFGIVTWVQVADEKTP